MPKRTNPFQHLVALIEAAICDDGDVVEESKELVDKITGSPREVDIVILKKHGSHEILMSVECTSSARPATVEWVEQMVARHSHLPSDKLVLVSEASFTSDALAKAKWLGVGALTLADAEDSDWKSLIRDIPSCRWKCIHFKCGTKIKVDLEGRPNLEIPPDTILFTPHGNEPANVIANRIMAEKILERVPESTWKVIESSDRHYCFELFGVAPPGSYLADDDGNHHTLLRVRASAELQLQKREVELRQQSYGDVAVASASGKIGDLPAIVVFTQKPNEDPVLNLSIRDQ